MEPSHRSDRKLGLLLAGLGSRSNWWLFQGLTLLPVMGCPGPPKYAVVLPGCHKQVSFEALIVALQPEVRRQAGMILSLIWEAGWTEAAQLWFRCAQKSRELPGACSRDLAFLLLVPCAAETVPD